MTPPRAAATLAAAVLLVVCSAAAALPSDPADPVAAAFADKELIWCFQGKGSSLFYDAGVVTSAFRRLPALRSNRVVVTGNSSGSIWAAYFACHGFSHESIEKLRSLAGSVDVSHIRSSEDIGTKITRVVAQKSTEMPSVVLVEAVAVALGVEDWSGAATVDDVVRRSRAEPRHPFVIVAANLDILGDGGGVRTSGERVFDARDFSVRWSDEAWARYERDPDAFVRENPGCALGATSGIGQACTYFCDPQTYAILRRIPAGQRLGDLRLVSTAADLALAVRASIAEPTYFAAVAEPEPAKLLCGDRVGPPETSRRRLYGGGFIMPVVAQDLRRMLPGTRVVGTGWVGLPLLARTYFQQRFGLDVQRIHHLSNWWLDAELLPPTDIQRRLAGRKLSPQAEYALAIDVTTAMLESSGPKPQYASQPWFAALAAEAIGGDHGATATGDAIRTMRGFGPVLENAAP
jgi:hypothetical protein